MKIESWQLDFLRSIYSIDSGEGWQAKSLVMPFKSCASVERRLNNNDNNIIIIIIIYYCLPE